MDIEIKPDPDTLKDEESQLAVFVEEKQNGNLSAISASKNPPQTINNKTQTESNLQQNTFPNMSLSSVSQYNYNNLVPIVPSGQIVPAVLFYSNVNSNIQEVAPSMALSLLPSEKNCTLSKKTRSDAALVTGEIFTSTNSSVQPNMLPTMVGPPVLYGSTSTVQIKGSSSNVICNPLPKFAPATISPLTPFGSVEYQQQFYPSFALHTGTNDSLQKASNNTRPVIVNSQKSVSLYREGQSVDHKLKNPKAKVNKISAGRGNGKITSYWRRRLLKTFQKEGCSLSAVRKIAVANNLNVENIIEFYDNIAKEAQEHVHEECDSLSFSNITLWLKYLKTIGAPKQCNYEAAYVLKAITNDEFHPDPESIGGVDLKAIYNFLTNALMGLPQQELSEASANFLSREFQNLINEANTDEADNDVRNMKTTIEDRLVRTVNGKSNNLDPLNTNIQEISKF